MLMVQKGFNCTLVNRSLPSLNEGSNEFTLTVPLTIKMAVQKSDGLETRLKIQTIAQKMN